MSEDERKRSDKTEDERKRSDKTEKNVIRFTVKGVEYSATPEAIEQTAVLLWTAVSWVASSVFEWARTRVRNQSQQCRASPTAPSVSARPPPTAPSVSAQPPPTAPSVSAQPTTNLSSSAPENECQICFSEPKDYALVPCGHRFCGSCISRFDEHQCPVCRRLYSSNMRIY